MSARCSNLGFAILEQTKCLRDYWHLHVGVFWNEDYAGGVLKTWNSGFWDKIYVYQILKSWICRFRSNRYVFELLQTCTSVIKKQK